MQSVSIKYSLKWRFKNQPQYAVTECKKVVNMRNNRLLKQVLNWWFNRLLDDVKSEATRKLSTYIMKRKLMKAKFNIEIKEI